MRASFWISTLSLSVSIAALVGGCKKPKSEPSAQAGSAQAGSAQAGSAQAGSAAPAAGVAPSLCKDTEQVIFSCTLKDQPGKLVALCGSKELTQSTGYVKYRSGTAGNVELEFPDTEQKTQPKFSYALDELHDGSEVFTVEFQQADMTYGVFTQQGPDVDVAGVEVAKFPDQPVGQNCATVHVDRLRELEKIVQKKGDPTPIDPAESCCCQNPKAPQPQDLMFRPAGECAKIGGAKCVDPNLCGEPAGEEEEE